MSGDDARADETPEVREATADIEVVTELNLVSEKFEPEAVAKLREESIESKRETTRKWIAFLLLGMLFLVSLAWILIGLFGPDSPTVAAALDKIFSAILALTGTVVGFYFGAASQEKNVN